MLYFVRAHVYLGRKLEVVVDFTALESTQIEVEPLQMKNQVIRNVFQASSRGELITDNDGIRGDIPFDCVNVTVTSRALILVV